MRRHFGCLEVATVMDLRGDVLGYVARPAFSRVEAHNSDRIAVLAFKQIGDDRLEVDLLGIGLAPSAAVLPEIVHYQINALVVRRYDRRRPATHDATPKTLHRPRGKIGGSCANCESALLR